MLKKKACSMGIPERWLRGARIGRLRVQASASDVGRPQRSTLPPCPGTRPTSNLSHVYLSPHHRPWTPATRSPHNHQELHEHSSSRTLQIPITWKDGIIAHRCCSRKNPFQNTTFNELSAFLNISNFDVTVLPREASKTTHNQENNELLILSGMC